MDRLTRHTDAGYAMPNVEIKYIEPIQTIYALCDKLAEYEDTGFTPEEICGLCEMDKCSRMAKMLRWEQAEAEGRLMILPCKVGDTAYRIIIDEIFEYTVKGFTGREKIETVHLEYCNNGSTHSCSFDVESLYFTRAEAEAALKGATK